MWLQFVWYSLVHRILLHIHSIALSRDNFACLTTVFYNTNFAYILLDWNELFLHFLCSVFIYSLQVEPDTMAGGSGDISNSLPLVCVLPTTQSTDSQSTPTTPSTGSSPVQTPLKGLVLAIVMGVVSVGII